LFLQTNNLDSAVTRLNNIGISLVRKKTENGVGFDAMIQDPFGNVISLMDQSKYPITPFEEPKIYNVGYSMNDIERAKEFYCNKLGFYVRTTKYFPALPLGHKDSTFAFMLHQRNVRPIKVDPEETQIMIIFSTKDIDSTVDLLRKKGVDISELPFYLSDEGLKSYSITDPFGTLSKLVEVN